VDRLEDVLRAGESSDDLVLLLRGGEDTSAKLLRQAALFEARYTYGGQSARGMSLFAASSVVDALAVLESKLRTYPKYRRCPGRCLPESQCSCRRSKRLIGPSCSGRLAEPVSRRRHRCVRTVGRRRQPARH
jgi:hypothetical protein